MQLVDLDFCLTTLFVIITFLKSILSPYFSQLKQLINNDDGNIFLTAYFKAFVLLNDLTEILILIVFLKSCLLIIF